MDISCLELPWEAITEPNLFNSELKRETIKGHTLYNVNVEAFARRVDCDDVLFKHGNSFSVVHLTYTKNEVLPYPITETYDSWEKLVSERLNPDVSDYTNDA